MDNQIYNIISDMSEVLDIVQMKKLQEVLIARLTVVNTKSEENNNSSYLEMFLTAKQIEGYQRINNFTTVIYPLIP